MPLEYERDGYDRGRDRRHPRAVVPPLLMILFRETSRHGGSTGTCAAVAANRLGVYEAVMKDDCPSTDEQHTVHFDVSHPDARQELSRRLPVVDWLVAIPRYVVLFVRYVMAIIAAIKAWFAVPFTGSNRGGTFDYVEGVMRSHNRVMRYAFTLAIDEHSPYPLGP